MGKGKVIYCLKIWVVGNKKTNIKPTYFLLTPQSFLRFGFASSLQTPLISPLQKQKSGAGDIEGSRSRSQSDFFLLLLPPYVFLCSNMGTPQAAAPQKSLLQGGPSWAVFSPGISLCPGMFPCGMLCEYLPWHGPLHRCREHLLCSESSLGCRENPQLLLLLGAAPLLFLTLLFPSPIWHFLLFLECLHTFSQ